MMIPMQWYTLMVIVVYCQVLGSADKDEEKDEKDDVLALRPPQPQMDKKISYNTELPR